MNRKVFDFLLTILTGPLLVISGYEGEGIVGISDIFVSLGVILVIWWLKFHHRSTTQIRDFYENE